MKRFLLALGILALVWPAVALAEPKTGLGLYAGVAQDHGEQKAQGASQSQGYDDTGVAVGVDYQFKLGSTTSLGVFAEATNNEDVSCSGCPSGTQVSRTALGLEFRYWIDTVFLGIRGEAAGASFMVKAGGGGTTTSNYSGAGLGLIAGWEGASGVFVKFAYDNTDQQYSKSGATTHDIVDSLRLFAGYRF